ncbi:MAG: C25 family cysteine peptidase, partial [bacterium]
PPYSDSVYWADARYMHKLMVDAGFVHIDSFAESFGQDTVDLLNAINDGRSYIMYRGTGGNGWGGPFFLYNPANMNNGFRLPIVLSATCGTIEGIGKLWLSAGTSVEPKGVVGFLGTTTGLFGAAEMRSALAKGTLENIFTDSISTLGKAAEAGRLKYFALFNDSLEYDSWNCLGDPEMIVWTTTPKAIDVSHNIGVHAGSCTLFVHVQYRSNGLPAESAFVCAMAKEDTSIYYYGRTNSAGNIEFLVHTYIPCDTIFFTVTGRNLQPYYGFTLVQFFGGPYVLMHSFSISDTSGGNSDSIANPGENIEIPVWVKNWGDSIAYDVSGIVQKISVDSFFTFSDTIKYFGDMQPFDSVSTTDGYNVIITPDCPDTHRIELQLVIRDINDSTWISLFQFTVHAPIILFKRYYFPGFLKYTPAGDTNQLIIELTNVGSYTAENATAKIFSSDSFFVPIDSTSSFGTILPDSIVSNQSNPFIITTSPQSPLGYPLDVKLELVSGVYVDTFDVTIYVGQREYLIWDPDPNHTSGPIVKAMLDSLNFNGVYSTNMIPYDDYLTLYKSLFVCVGILPNTYVIKDTSQAGLEIERYLTVFNGKVYMEGGNVWYSDPLARHGYLFHPLFCIDPIADAIGPFPHVSGEAGTFTQSMLFSYSGETNSIDRIHPDSGGILIFRKTTDNAYCGVAANNRTVGTSFELGGLDDSIAPSTKLVLVDSIMEYFGIPPTGILESGTSQYTVVKSIGIYPNPAKQKVMMEFIGFSTEGIIVKIYDVSGRLVKDILITLDALYTTRISWDGSNNHGDKLPCGVYFLKIDAEDYTETKKVILLR